MQLTNQLKETYYNMLSFSEYISEVLQGDDEELMTRDEFAKWHEAPETIDMFPKAKEDFLTIYEIIKNVKDVSDGYYRLSLENRRKVMELVNKINSLRDNEENSSETEEKE